MIRENFLVQAGGARWLVFMICLTCLFASPFWIRRNLSVLTSWSENESGTSSVPLLLLAIKSSGAVDVLDEAEAMGNLADCRLY